MAGVFRIGNRQLRDLLMNRAIESIDQYKAALPPEPASIVLLEQRSEDLRRIVREMALLDFDHQIGPRPADQSLGAGQHRTLVSLDIDLDKSHVTIDYRVEPARRNFHRVPSRVARRVERADSGGIEQPGFLAGRHPQGNFAVAI